MRKKLILLNLGFVMFFMYIYIKIIKKMIKINKDNKIKKDKLYKNYMLLIEWLSWKNQGKSVSEWLLRHGIKTIAIYGMGELGNRLYEELKNSNGEIKMVYAVDKDILFSFSELPILSLEDDLPKTDAIIVTPFFAFNSIEKELKNKIPDVSIISLAVIFEI